MAKRSSKNFDPTIVQRSEALLRWLEEDFPKLKNKMRGRVGYHPLQECGQAAVYELGQCAVLGMPPPDVLISLIAKVLLEYSGQKRILATGKALSPQEEHTWRRGAQELGIEPSKLGSFWTAVALEAQHETGSAKPDAAPLARIAEQAGVSTKTVQAWRARPDYQKWVRALRK